jgi:hypothetical protein
MPGISGPLRREGRVSLSVAAFNTSDLFVYLRVHKISVNFLYLNFECNFEEKTALGGGNAPTAIGESTLK